MTIIILLLYLIGIQGNDPIFIVKTKTYLSLLIHQKKNKDALCHHLDTSTKSLLYTNIQNPKRSKKPITQPPFTRHENQAVWL